MTIIPLYIPNNVIELFSDMNLIIYLKITLYFTKMSQNLNTNPYYNIVLFKMDITARVQRK